MVSKTKVDHSDDEYEATTGDRLTWVGPAEKAVLEVADDCYTKDTALVGIPEGFQLVKFGEFRKWRIIAPIVSFHLLF